MSGLRALVRCACASAALSACATATATAIAAPPVCAPEFSPATAIEVYFGRNIPGGGEVSDADWAAFLDEEVTPRFPDGFSVFDADGQYRMTSGEIVTERSKALSVATTDIAAARPLIAALSDAYIARFRQEGVLVTEQAACLAFLSGAD